MNLNKRISRKNVLRRHMLVPRSATVGSVLKDTFLGITFAALFTLIALAMASVFASFACHFATSCNL